MIIKRLVCFSNTFLGKAIDTGLGKPSFNINQLKVKEDDFIKAILNYEKTYGGNHSVIKPLSFQAVKKRVGIEEVYWNPDGLNVVWVDKETGFFWSFVFTSPSDKVEVDQAGD